MPQVHSAVPRLRAVRKLRLVQPPHTTSRFPDSVVHVIDDDHGLRTSLQGMLAAHGLESRGYRSAEAFLQEYVPSGVECALVDLRMPGLSGLQLIQKLAPADMPFIVMTGHGDIRSAVTAMKLGTLDYLEKPFSGAAMVSRVNEALDLSHTRQARKQREAERNRLIGELTTRERQVLELVCQGLASKQIARDLSLSVKTVETYRCRIMAKVGAANTVELIRITLL